MMTFLRNLTITLLGGKIITLFVKLFPPRSDKTHYIEVFNSNVFLFFLKKFVKIIRLKMMLKYHFSKESYHSKLSTVPMKMYLATPYVPIRSF